MVHFICFFELFYMATTKFKITYVVHNNSIAQYC